ncbi:hypothetical protein Aperf_G00000063096 [Anoplocephala perfoliata]
MESVRMCLKELTASSDRRNICVNDNEFLRQAVDKVVSEVVVEERNYKQAMLHNTKLPFPCRCGAICSYSLYLKPIITAFDKLYEEYVELHRDFKNLFDSSWTRPMIRVEYEGDTVVKHDNVTRILYSQQQPPPQESGLPTIIDPNRIRVTPLETSSPDETTPETDFCKKHKEEEESFRIMILRKRIALKLEKPSIWARFLAYIYAYKQCLCLYCDYRDCVNDYQRAILKLKNEYGRLYRRYEILFGAVDMLPPEGNKKVIMLSRTQHEMEGETAIETRKT